MKIIAVTQARYGSTRLPGKVLLKIREKTLLQIHLERALKSKKIDGVILATTFEEKSSEIIDIAKKLNIPFYQGSTNNVLDRFYQAVKPINPDYVVRITSDCPLIDSVLMDEIIERCIADNNDYCSNTLEPTYPDGMDVEVFKFSALEDAWNKVVIPSDKEHVTPYIWRNSTAKGMCQFKSENFEGADDYSKYRLTVDTIADFELISKLVGKIGDTASWLEYVNVLSHDNKLFNINSGLERNEGFKKSISEDPK